MAISSIDERNVPKPNTPTPIRKASEIEQIRHVMNTCSFINPCLNTKTFCGPMAKIKAILITNPSSQIDSIVNQLALLSAALGLSLV